jgi:hypothetical protein
MYVIFVGSVPISQSKEARKRYKEIFPAPDRPEYMNHVGTWGYYSDENWNAVQVFDVERSRVADALERMDTSIFNIYGDIPGFRFTNRVAYGPEEGFKIAGLD